MSTKDEAIERLKRALPSLMIGLREAGTKGKPIFTIASQKEDGSGTMILEIKDPEGLLKDIGELVGFTGITKEDSLEFSANQFLAKFGLNRGNG